MNNAILKIGDYSFVIERSFSDGYKNTLRPVASLLYRTHPTSFIWEGGEFKPLSIAINLAVDDKGQAGINTPQALNKVLATIFSYSVAPVSSVNKGNTPSLGGPKPIIVSVGDWFSRRGRITDLDIEFRPPWDIETGMPLVAEVKFTLLYDFLANEDVKDSRKTPTSGDVAKGFKLVSN
jgi:hypothetical protein